MSVRKHELTTLKFILSDTKRSHEKTVLLRAAIPLIYSHWEGFVKAASTAYLEYVSRQAGTLKEYQNNFIALACRNKIMVAGKSKKTKPHKVLIDHFFDIVNRSIKIHCEEAINTESNLSSEVLKEIMCTIGIRYDNYWQKKGPIIDHQLVKNRNEIVHGNMLQVDVSLFNQLHGLVIECIERFKTEIENAALMKAYKR